MRRSGYSLNPSNQGGVQHSDAAQAPNGLGGGSSLLYSQINVSLPLVSGTETRFNKICPISPGTLSAGCFIRYRAWGYYTIVVGTPALEIVAKLYNGVGATLGLLSDLVIPVAPNGVANVNWHIDCGLVVRVAGSSGNFIAEQGRNYYNRDNTLALPTITTLSVGLNTPFAVDIGQATVLGVAAQWTPADPSNQVFMIGSEVFVDYPATTS